MNGHFHGAFGKLRFKDIADSWVEVQVHTNQVTFNQQVDTAEDTGMSPEGRAKTSLLGLIDRSLTFPMFLQADGTIIKKIDALQRAGVGTAAEWYPSGDDTGNFYMAADGTTGELLFTGMDFSGGNSGAGTVNVSGKFSGDVTIETAS